MGRFLAIVLWIIYFLSPIDLIPDFIPGIGRLDDLILLFFLLYSLFKRGASDSQESSGYHNYGQGSFRYESEQSDDGSRERSHEPRDPYRILGLDRSATVEDIKRAYRTQATRYHPDKVSHLGEEFQVLAKQKFQDIQWAHETLLKERKAS